MFNKGNNSNAVNTASEEARNEKARRDFQAGVVGTCIGYIDENGLVNSMRIMGKGESVVFEFDPKMGLNNDEYEELMDSMSRIGGILAARKKQMEDCYARAHAM